MANMENTQRKKRLPALILQDPFRATLKNPANFRRDQERLRVPPEAIQKHSQHINCTDASSAKTSEMTRSDP